MNLHSPHGTTLSHRNGGHWGAWLRLMVSVWLVAGPALAVPPGETASPAQRFGWLQVSNGRLCAESGAPVQLRGMSTHDLKFFPLTTNTVARLVQDWQMSLIRAAMYTDSYGSSYIREPKVKEQVKLIVDEALRQGIYVIVDWHILQDGNPNQHKAQAKAFFEEMTRAYARHPNLIYEICNEPNGSNVTWKDIKAYAEYIIPAIRALAPRNIIIVGTDTWCQGVRATADAPLAFSNVMYGLHFYPGSHREELRQNADAALARGLPIFVSEWGLTDATGKGALYLEEAQKWMDWMNAHKLSWANWSFSNAGESSAALKPAARIEGPWLESDLTPSGEWVKLRMRDGR